MILFFQKFSMKTRFAWVMLAFLVVFGLFVVFNSTPWGITHLKTLSGGKGLLDTLFWYTPTQAFDVVQAWGGEGRAYYLTRLLPLDTLFLLAYTSFLVLLMLYLLKKVNPASPWLYFLPLSALAGGGCDLLENGLLSLQVLLFPTPWMPLFWPAAVITAGKWILVAVSAGCVLLLVGSHLVQRFLRLVKSGSE